MACKLPLMPHIFTIDMGLLKSAGCEVAMHFSTQSLVFTYLFTTLNFSLFSDK